MPWGHNIALLTRLKAPEWRLAYAHQAIEHGWSRNVLNIHIETQRLEREGKAVTNFDLRLPQPQSDLARESLKDPYRLDFLGLGKEAEERAIESALVQHITHFLIELGAGFAFVGRQVPLEVGEEEKKFQPACSPLRASASPRDPFDALDPATAALFPGSFQDSEAGHIPKGWNLQPIGEVVDCVGGGTPSTTFAEISKQNFRPIPVVLPPKELMVAFTTKVAPLYAQITANLHQSRTLATLRDTLLPKLLSGKLSVTRISDII